jgi:hypothetical protein
MKKRTKEDVTSKKKSSRKGVGAVTSNVSSNIPTDGILFASKIMNVGRRRKKHPDDEDDYDDDDDDDDSQQRYNNNNEKDQEYQEEEEEYGRTNIDETKQKTFLSTCFDKSVLQTTVVTKKKKKGKKERQQEVVRSHEDSATTTISTISTIPTNADTINHMDSKLSTDTVPPSSSSLSSSHRQHPKKIRSRQKNIRKDTRLEEHKPSHLRWGKKDYRGRPLTLETQLQLQLPQSKSKQQQEQYAGLQGKKDTTCANPFLQSQMETKDKLEFVRDECIMGGLGIDNLLQDPIAKDDTTDGSNTVPCPTRKLASVQKKVSGRKSRVAKYKNLR